MGVADPLHILKKYWGFSAFRPLQREIIDAVLAGHPTLALLPTGGGKSICFQVPALCQEGICLVVTPLIALMKDQVAQLSQRGIKAESLHSGMTSREIDLILDNCAYGKVKFLYLSPERLKTDILKERVKKMQVSLLAIDEAHCISQWGYDFRPAYLEIAEFRKFVPDAKLVALTATATKIVKADILEKLQFEEPRVFQKSFARKNLSYAVFNQEYKEGKMLEVLTNVKGSAIVYLRSRNRTQHIAKWLQQNRISAAAYHAGLSNLERSRLQDLWIRGELRVMVATNAFGMGVDKPDVRVVVHLDLPDSLEAYYQEAGRAGRDENRAYAVLLYSRADWKQLRTKVDQAFPEVDFIRRIYQSLANYYSLAIGSNLMESYPFDLNDFAHYAGHPASEVFYALKKLQEENIIQVDESILRLSKVHFKLNHDEIYKFQVANSHLDPMIKGLLRLYGGELYHNYVAIKEADLSQLMQIPMEEVKRQLNALNSLQVIDYEAQSENPRLTFLTARQDAQHLQIDRKRLRERKKIVQDKVEAMIDYSMREDKCRTQMFQEYFDEAAYLPCGVCDFCIAEKKRSNANVIRRSMEPRIKELLTNAPLPVHELVKHFPSSEHFLVTSITRQLLDEGVLKFDQYALLQIKK